MAVIDLPLNVMIGVNTDRHDLKAGKQEVSAEIEKALIEAGILEAKKAGKQTEK